MRKIKCVTRTATSSAPVHRNRISLSRFKTVFINNARRPGQNRTVNTIVLCPIRDNGSKFPDGFALDFRLSAIRQQRVVPDRANWPYGLGRIFRTNFPDVCTGVFSRGVLDHAETYDCVPRRRREKHDFYQKPNPGQRPRSQHLWVFVSPTSEPDECTIVVPFVGLSFWIQDVRVGTGLKRFCTSLRLHLHTCRRRF